MFLRIGFINSIYMLPVLESMTEHPILQFGASEKQSDEAW
jgi:hypothetical protein